MAKASEWATRVEAWRASGKSASELCRGRKHTAKNLQWWVSHFRRHGGPAEAPERAKHVARARVVRVQGTGPLPLHRSWSRSVRLASRFRRMWIVRRSAGLSMPCSRRRGEQERDPERHRSLRDARDHEASVVRSSSTWRMKESVVRSTPVGTSTRASPICTTMSPPLDGGIDRRITFVKATLVDGFAVLGLLSRFKRLDQSCRLFAEYSRPLQNSRALFPLAFHSETRPAHSSAFAMRAIVIVRVLERDGRHGGCAQMPRRIATSTTLATMPTVATRRSAGGNLRASGQARRAPAPRKGRAGRARSTNASEAKSVT